MRPAQSTPSLERRLRAYRAEYARLKARLREIGFICTGSLATRWTVCGKPTCRCRQRLTLRHGPYYQLTWKEAGVTVTQRLSPEHARLYREWITNRRRLEALVVKMQQVSGKAARQLLQKEGATNAATRSRSTPSARSRRP